MPTIGEAYEKAYADGRGLGVTAMDLRLLIMKDEGLRDQIDVMMQKGRVMSSYPLFLSQVERLKKGEPVEYIINQASFLGHSLYVDPRVLIPRGETEELVAQITERIPSYYDPRNHLVCADIGTGSGAIAIALKTAFPNWVMFASDVSSGALEVAQKNIAASALRIETLQGDSLEPYIASGLALDIIVSNPPYIADKKDAQASVRDYEPAEALWLDKGRSVYESVIANVRKAKKGSLFLAFEISPDLVGWLADMIKADLPDGECEFAKDLNGLDRFLFVYLR